MAKLANRYTGADLAGLVRQASLHALKDYISTESNVDNSADLEVSNEHFLKAMRETKPSVSVEVSLVYLYIYKLKKIFFLLFNI